MYPLLEVGLDVASHDAEEEEEEEGETQDDEGQQKLLSDPLHARSAETERKQTGTIAREKRT